MFAVGEQQGVVTISCRSRRGEGRRSGYARDPWDNGPSTARTAAGAGARCRVCGACDIVAPCPCTQCPGHWEDDVCAVAPASATSSCVSPGDPPAWCPGARAHSLYFAGFPPFSSRAIRSE